MPRLLFVFSVLLLVSCNSEGRDEISALECKTMCAPNVVKSHGKYGTCECEIKEEKDDSPSCPKPKESTPTPNQCREMCLPKGVSRYERNWKHGSDFLCHCHGAPTKETEEEASRKIDKQMKAFHGTWRISKD